MEPLWSETCWSTFKYFIILIVSMCYILCITWIVKCLIINYVRYKHEDYYRILLFLCQRGWKSSNLTLLIGCPYSQLMCLSSGFQKKLDTDTWHKYQDILIAWQGNNRQTGRRVQPHSIHMPPCHHCCTQCAHPSLCEMSQPVASKLVTELWRNNTTSSCS